MDYLEIIDKECNGDEKDFKAKLDFFKNREL